MANFVIVADSACDIPEDKLREWGVTPLPLTFLFDDDQIIHSDYDMASKQFYDRMREGGVARTAAANAGDFIACFEPLLKSGADILYLCFSSGLSSTFRNACLAAADLTAEYTERKMTVIDSLSASGGFGLLLYLAVQKKAEGACLEETADYIEKLKPHICHWFTVDSLVYLKRGGRISPAAALLGGALDIRPVLHTDNEGHLTTVSKVRGRRASLKALADKYGELAETPGEGPAFITHGDCPEDVEKLKALLSERYGLAVDLVANIGPVIGAHSGPGTMAFFFIGKER